MYRESGNGGFILAISGGLLAWGVITVHSFYSYRSIPSLWLTSIQVIKKVVDRLIRSPLRDIPGPLPAKLTTQWLLFIDLAGNRSTYIHKLHQMYGPIVRIGPNEVSFASIDAINDIYLGQKPFMKSAAYENFGRKGAFQMRDKEEHRQRQKRISHVFSQSVLLEMEPLMKEEVGNLLKAVETRIGKEFDMLFWFRMMALDIVGMPLPFFSPT
jgi:hypothetical protein